jgi:hypothetical protein
MTSWCLHEVWLAELDHCLRMNFVRNVLMTGGLPIGAEGHQSWSPAVHEEATSSLWAPPTFRSRYRGLLLRYLLERGYYDNSSRTNRAPHCKDSAAANRKADNTFIFLWIKTLGGTHV